MLLRGLLYFMVHVNRQCPQFADKSCTFLPLRCPFPPGLRLSPTSLLPPKLPIKTNLAPREIKPTSAEDWHQLQASRCAFRTSDAPPPSLSLCLSFSRPLAQTPHSAAAISFSLTPTCPSLQMNVQLQKRGFHNMVIVSTGHLYGWVHDPHSQIQ